MSDRLHYSPLAQLDLDEIAEYYSVERGDSAKGHAIVMEILSATEAIPGRATRYPPVGPMPFTTDIYRFVNVGSYLIFFRAVDEEIYIDRILYKRRDYLSLLGL